jgi:hypothetical protein
VPYRRVVNALVVAWAAAVVVSAQQARETGAPSDPVAAVLTEARAIEDCRLQIHGMKIGDCGLED